MVVGDGFVFVHVPRTGGTAITAALGGRSGGRLHAPRWMIAKDYPGVRCFGFVRNPWDWMASVYAYNCQKQTFSEADHEYQERIREQGFREWLLHGRMQLKDDPKGRGRRPAPMQRRSQMYWLRGCEWVERFEGLSGAFEAICAAWGIRHSRVEHVNGSEHPPYRELYDGEMRRHVAHYCAEEIERFGYSF